MAIIHNHLSQVPVSSQLHECNRVEKTHFKVHTPHVRKERPENRRESSMDLRVSEFDLDKRRGGETEDDRLYYA